MIEEQLPFTGSTITIIVNSNYQGGAGAAGGIASGRQILKAKLRITQKQVGEGKPTDYEGVDEGSQVIEL